MEIGVQFYTLRNKCTDLKSFSDTLARVADMGVREVQISGVCDYEGEWLNEELKKNGLRCVLTHYKTDDIINKPLEVLDKHKLFGCTSIGIGCMPGLATPESYANFVKNFKPSAKIISQNGGMLFYHNHAFEFERTENGVTYFDKLLSEFDKNEMQITLDTYWAAFAGVDLPDLIKKLDGRLNCVHLKDLAIIKNEQKMAVVGEGNINFEKILPLLEEAGAKHLLIEQDETYGECPFECLKRSYKNLKAMGL